MSVEGRRGSYWDLRVARPQGYPDLRVLTTPVPGRDKGSDGDGPEEDETGTPTVRTPSPPRTPFRD